MTLRRHHERAEAVRKKENEKIGGVQVGDCLIKGSPNGVNKMAS